MSAQQQTLVLTGATGFIGSALLERFLERGWTVVALSRTSPANPHAGVRWEPYDLRGEVPRGVFEGASAFVHAAYVDARDGPSDVNVTAGQKLANAAHAAGVPCCVFLSSLAAGPEALSAYGMQKFAVERFFSAAGDAVVRPGLVLGNGGLFARMRDHLRKSPVVPLIGGGNQPMQTVHIGDLTEGVLKIVELGLPGTFTIAQPEPVAYGRFYRDLGAALGVTVRFIPVPFWLACAAVSVAGRLHLRLPIGRDNLLGLKAMQRRGSAADLARLDLRLRPYRQALEAAAQGE